MHTPQGSIQQIQPSPGVERRPAINPQFRPPSQQSARSNPYQEPPDQRIHQSTGSGDIRPPAGLMHPSRQQRMQRPPPPSRPLSRQGSGYSQRDSHLSPPERPQFTSISAATRDLLKNCIPSDKKYDGHEDKSVAVFKRDFMSLIDKSLKLPHSVALENMRALLKEEASECCEANLKDKATSSDQAFSEMENAFCASAISEAAKEEWDEIKLDDFRIPGKSDKKALDRLITLQKQAPCMHRADPFFKGMIKRATKKEAFLSFFNSSETSKTSQQHASQLKLAMRRNENKIGLKERDLSEGSFYPPNKTPTPAFAKEFLTQSYHNPAKRSCNDNFDRRRQKPQSEDQHGRHNKRHHKLNGIDKKTGKRRKCFGCGAEDHLIKQCKSSSKLMHCVAAMSPAEDKEAQHNDIMRKLESIELQQREAEESQDPSNSSQQNDPAKNFYNGLANSSTAHAILCAKSIDQRVIQEESTNFKGIVMDNGAEVTAGGAPQHNACLKHTKTKTDLLPSDQAFQFGACLRKSLGIAKMRMPLLDDHHFLEYESHIIDMSAPLLLGLDSFKKYGFYVNVCADRLIHNDQGWGVPLVLKQGHLHREFEDVKKIDMPDADQYRARQWPQMSSCMQKPICTNCIDVLHILQQISSSTC